jgi:hypothetical protein
MSKREIPKLNKENFMAWQSLMKLHLGSISDYAQTCITTEHVDPTGTPSAQDMKNKQDHNQAMLEHIHSLLSSLTISLAVHAFSSLLLLQPLASVLQPL